MTHFVTITFKKVQAQEVSSDKMKVKQQTGDSEMKLAPCLYKKR